MPRRAGAPPGASRSAMDIDIYERSTSSELRHKYQDAALQ
jgi:hypothetical protein